MSENVPDFVTQVKRKDDHNNINTIQEDDNDDGCCSCLFGGKKKKTKPAQQQQNNNNTNEQKPNPDTQIPVIAKISITPTHSNSDPDRDKLGLNSPRGREDNRVNSVSSQQVGLLPPQKKRKRRKEMHGIRSR